MSVVSEPTLTVLDWDTSFLGCKTARLESGEKMLSEEQLDAWLARAEADGVELIYFSAPSKPGNLQLNERWTGGEPVEEKLTYVLAGFDDAPGSYPDGIRPYKPSDREAMIAFSLRSGYLSRFRLDPEMDRRCTSVGEPSVADRLYTKWAYRSIDGSMADEIFVFEDEGEVMGMIAMSVTDGTARMTIAGVDERFGGRGIGTKLVRAVHKCAKDRGAEKLIVVTQRKNLPARALYDKTGFEEFASEHFYHFWRRR